MKHNSIPVTLVWVVIRIAFILMCGASTQRQFFSPRGRQIQVVRHTPEYQSKDKNYGYALTSSILDPKVTVKPESTDEGQENTDPRFMLGMLGSIEKSWSLKKPSFFGTPVSQIADPDTDVDDNDSLFCRLSKRQSIIMFSFCKEEERNKNKNKDNDKDKDKQEVSDSQNENQHQNKNHNENQAQDQSSVENKYKTHKRIKEKGRISEYNSEGLTETAFRKNKVKKKNGVNKKNKNNNRVQHLNRNQLLTMNQIPVQNLEQIHSFGSGQPLLIMQTPLNKNNMWPKQDSVTDTPEDESMSSDYNDAESKTEAPMMSMPSQPSNSNLRFPGKPKIILKSDASIQIIYELDLTQLKLAQQGTKIQKEMEKMKSEHIEKIIEEQLANLNKTSTNLFKPNGNHENSEEFRIISNIPSQSQSQGQT